MKADIIVRGERRGSVSLDETTGRAVPSNAAIADMLDGLYVAEPGTAAHVTEADGDRYIAALPATLGGSYVFVRLTGAGKTRK